MESDPVVSSTVFENDVEKSSRMSDLELKNDVSDNKMRSVYEKPPRNSNESAEKFLYNGSQSGLSVEKELHEKPGDDFVLKSFRSDSYFADIEIPEMEFDEYGVELAGDKESSPDLNPYLSGRVTPDGLIDEDFEQELGSAVRELSVQDVIDSDFPDISRLGVLQVAGDDKLGRKVITFSACRLPMADLIDHQRLLLYITKTLEQYVISDYSLVYFHCGLTNKNKPRFGWLVQAYRTFDRNFRKNLKALYIVHPTLGIKVLWSFFKPFISSKMTQKVHYVEQLSELEEHLFVNQLPVPHRVLEYDKFVSTKLKDRTSTQPVNSIAHLTVGPPRVDLGSVISGQFDDQIEDVPFEPQRQFNVSLEFIKMNNGGRTIPVVLEDAVDYLRDRGLNVEWIFRRSVSVLKLREAQDAYNRGDSVDLREYDDPHLAASLLKSFLRELAEPLLTFELYDEILAIGDFHGRAKVSAIKDLILQKLPETNYEVLNYLVRFLTEITVYSPQNKMNASNLAVVFGPSLIWSRHHTSLNAITMINAFVQVLITHYESIFIK